MYTASLLLHFKVDNEFSEFVTEKDIFKIEYILS